MVYRARRYGPEEIARLRVVCNTCGAALEYLVGMTRDTVRTPLTRTSIGVLADLASHLDESQGAS